MNRNILIFSTFLLVGAVLGFGFGKFVGNQWLSQKIRTLQAQIEQAKKLLPSTPTDMRSMGGKIMDVSANSFVLEVSSFNPFDDFATIRTVTTNTNTKVVLLKQKDQAIYREEVAVFQESLRKGEHGESPVSAPASFEEAIGTFSDIKRGQFVSVQADHNIRDEKNFTATEVRIHLPSDNR